MTSAAARPAHVGDRVARETPHEARLAAAVAGAQDEPRQDHARARRQVERELVQLVDRSLPDEDDAAHRAARADGAPAHHPQLADRRRRRDGHEREIRLVLRDAPCDLARRRAVQAHASARGLAVQPLVERPGVEVADRRHPQARRGHETTCRCLAALRSRTLNAASGRTARGCSRTTL